MPLFRHAGPARHTLAATVALAVAAALFAAPSAAMAAPGPTLLAAASGSSAPMMATTANKAATSATADERPVLRRGSTGAAVEEWQRIVTYVLGEGSIVVDGRFGPKTRAATLRVQTMFDLEADGVVGPLTWGATRIVHAPENVHGLDLPVADVGHLEIGDRGDRVVRWQRLLDDDPRSTSRTVADGIFGPATLAATKAFQSRYGLVADGVVGPKTRATMQDVRDDV